MMRTESPATPRHSITDLRISAVVPVFNGAATLQELYERLEAVLSVHAVEWEIVLVEDAGADDAWSVIRGLAARDPRVRGFRMSRNYGQHNALLLGVRAAKFDVVVTLDDDLQNPPEQIPELLAKLTADIDCVYGYPHAERHGLLRNIASKTTKLVLSRAMGADVAERVSAFRAFRTDLRRAFDRYDAPYVNLDVLLTWGSQRFTVVAVRRDSRAHGVSNYSVRKLVVHAVNMITGFSVLPLQLASLLGLGFAGFGGCVLIYVLGRYLIEGSVVPGFAFSASSIAIFSGVQLFALGVIGEYLARIHFRTMRKPPYVVRETTDRMGTAAERDPPSVD